MAVRINRESTPPTPKSAGENYFRFGAAILEIDRGPQAGHGTVNPVEIDQQTTKIWRDGKSCDVGSVVFDHLQPWWVIAGGDVFECLPVCEIVFRRIGTVGGSARRFVWNSSVAAPNRK